MLLKKIKDKGFFGTLLAVLDRLGIFVKTPFLRLAQYNSLEKGGFTVVFIHEGSTAIKLPRVSPFNCVFGSGAIFKRNLAYATRPSAEALLRKTIFEMYESEYINPALSIVDIGSWISDNAVVWAQYLSRGGCVYAIDPSPENLSYGKILAELNNVENIKWIEAVCSEKVGIELDFDGSIDHAKFKTASSGSHFKSSTIDKIMEQANAAVGLLHVDVEGFELSVLKGASGVIARDMPVILFEQHISKEDFRLVSKYLKSLDYRVFMINEVLSGCELDCRNFLAFPSQKGVPKLKKFEQSDGRQRGIYSAVIGNAIIEV